MSDDLTESQFAILENHVAALREHFDTVQVFCTNVEPANDGSGMATAAMDYGQGNAFARQGQVREWLIRHEAVARKDAVNRYEDD